MTRFPGSRLQYHFGISPSFQFFFFFNYLVICNKLIKNRFSFLEFWTVILIFFPRDSHLHHLRRTRKRFFLKGYTLCYPSGGVADDQFSCRPTPTRVAGRLLNNAERSLWNYNHTRWMIHLSFYIYCILKKIIWQY